MANVDKIIIKKADINDAESIFNIQIASYQASYHETQDTLAGKIARTNAICYVAVCNNMVAGYILSYPEKENYTSNLDEEYTNDTQDRSQKFSIWYLHDLAIHPSFQGLNIAKKLYNKALEEAKKLNLKTSKLVAVQDAALFWHKLGYKKIGKPDDNAGYLVEAIVMEKEL